MEAVLSRDPLLSGGRGYSAEKGATPFKFAALMMAAWCVIMVPKFRIADKLPEGPNIPVREQPACPPVHWRSGECRRRV